MAARSASTSDIGFCAVGSDHLYQVQRPGAAKSTRLTWVLLYLALTSAACAAPKAPEPSKSCREEPVPAVAPDTVPAWFGHDTSYSNVFLKHIIAVRFDSTATTADRRRAIESVCGRVVGGWHLAGPSEDIYAVQVADDGDQVRLADLVRRIQTQPKVVSAGMEPKLTITPH